MLTIRMLYFNTRFPIALTHENVQDIYIIYDREKRGAIKHTFDVLCILLVYVTN